jgi:CRP/FNR family transcriptional regulator, cyclic AMP receptor protein
MTSPKTRKKAKAASPPGLDVGAMLVALRDGASESTYGKKETIFHQGDAADAVFYVRKGNVQICVVSRQGKEGVIAVLGAGAFFGEGCLAGQALNMASAVATAPTVVVKIDKASMVRALHDQPKFAQMFTAFLLVRNIQTEADLVDQLFNSSEKRLARALLLLSNFGKDGKMEKVIPKVNQDALAARIGTTRSRISFFMNKFRKLGFIEYNGELKVHSSLLNVIVHDASDAHEVKSTAVKKRKPVKGKPQKRKAR